MQQKKKVIISGATGQFGLYQVQYLIQNEDVDIFALVRWNSPNKDKIDDLQEKHANIHIIPWNLGD